MIFCLLLLFTPSLIQKTSSEERKGRTFFLQSKTVNNGGEERNARIFEKKEKRAASENDGPARRPEKNPIARAITHGSHFSRRYFAPPTPSEERNSIELAFVPRLLPTQAFYLPRQATRCVFVSTGRSGKGRFIERRARECERVGGEVSRRSGNRHIEKKTLCLLFSPFSCSFQLVSLKKRTVRII